MKREALGILHGLERFCNYFLPREVSIITDNKSPVAILKDVVTLSQGKQYILLMIHLFKVRILYKPGQELFITDWLSRHNHTKNKDAEIHGMGIKVDAIQIITNVPEYMSIP